ncbi:unnamed protein product [Bursaphelenchus xylophilus]|uniref:(pine wood nematode) hypothetical protein n=1 Tax=Bursaphelenchus xylophilus TaxID=6326 RepID=A0A1I7S8Q4_BURXY|nr:unnamed protein product [Bursaphelenchus xylophilus]CAG9089333.1 unnamed protein product [Bursaphelenchus xylophilus]
MFQQESFETDSTEVGTPRNFKDNVTFTNNLSNSSCVSMDLEPSCSVESEKKRLSISEEAKKIKEKANRLIVRIPAEQLRKIANTTGVNSIRTETQHFVGIASLHGPIRIYRSHGQGRFFWVFAMSFCIIMMCLQIYKLVTLASQQPIVSQISFRLPEEGLQYPLVTICSFNYVTKHYLNAFIKKYNVSNELTRFILMTSLEVQSLQKNEQAQIAATEEEYLQFVNRTPEFSLNRFFRDAAPSCNDTLRICTYSSEEFNCCDYAKSIMTDLGNCYQIDLDYYARSKGITPQPGVGNGLQVYADFHSDEQPNTTYNDFMSNVENGFRYFIHSRDAVPYINSEGTSVSPGRKAFSSVSPNHYILHPSGNRCSQDWVEEERDDILTTHNYSSSLCQAHCFATHLFGKCKCVPFLYSLNGTYNTCSVAENYNCLKTIFDVDPSSDSEDILKKIAPDCSRCRMECDRWDYQVYTSYSDGFSRAVAAYLKKHEKIRDTKLKKDFVGIAVFFREISFTEYEQVERTSLSEILSDIGGNMGLFLGMSVLSVIEIIIYLVKVSWLFVSSKRRAHMATKGEKQLQRQKRIEETLDEIANSEDQETRSTVAARLKRLAGSIKRKTAAVWHPYGLESEKEVGPDDDPKLSTVTQSPSSYYLDNIVAERTMGMGKAIRPNEIVELELDLGSDSDSVKNLDKRKKSKIGRSHTARPKISTIFAARTIIGEDNAAFEEEQRPGIVRQRSQSYIYPEREKK